MARPDFAGAVRKELREAEARGEVGLEVRAAVGALEVRRRPGLPLQVEHNAAAHDRTFALLVHNAEPAVIWGEHDAIAEVVGALGQDHRAARSAGRPDHRHGRFDALERRALAPVLSVVASDRVHIHLRPSLGRQLRPLGVDAPPCRRGPGRARLDAGVRVGFGIGAVGQLERIVDGSEVAMPRLDRAGVLPRQLLNTTIDRRQVGIVRDPQWADRRGGEANAIKSIEAQVASADPHPKGESQSGGAEHHGEPVSGSPSKG
mmetsp:Transcript_97181/g.278180  ORF Transcript_97181/g.278180 Transcript_97181/m.278180 type:complete len:261 (+) Transcript_97181:1956-2738(+)